MIESYKFGKIIIDGKIYTKDVEVRWDGEVLDWWRQKGHMFQLPDLERAIDRKPEIIILGTGEIGIAQVSEDLKHFFKNNKIEHIIEKTPRS